MDPVIGHIEGVAIGSSYRNRQALRDAGIHRPLQAGIDYSKTAGCSVVVSGGYVDDFDSGNEIIYTGHGGNDPATKRQIKDQEWHRGNEALRKSQRQRLPVRVCRGHKGDPRHSPREGYRYDGLYLVKESWDERGVDGFRICRFHLEAANQLIEAHTRPGPVESPSANEPTVVAAPSVTPTPMPSLNEPGYAQDWIAELVATPQFHYQRQAAGGASLSVARFQHLVGWLDANGGRLTHEQLAGVLRLPARRVPGLVASARRVTNVDGYEVLTDDGNAARLDAALARAQFGVT
jgi:hypothetical protein